MCIKARRHKLAGFKFTELNLVQAGAESAQKQYMTLKRASLFWNSSNVLRSNQNWR